MDSCRDSWMELSDTSDQPLTYDAESEICSKEGNAKRLWKKVKYELIDENRHLSEEGKERNAWKKGKCQLIEYHALPGYLKDNEYILGYYRAEWPLKHMLLSIFSIHNETLNVWTHLIGFFMFLFLTVYTATKVPKVVDMHSLPDFLRRTDMQKIYAELLKCLPSLPDMPGFQKLKDDLRTSLPSMEFLSSVPGWQLMELLRKCLPDQFVATTKVDSSDLMANMDTLTMIKPITRWPFFVFLGGAMFCLLASSTCHLLAPHSRRSHYIFLRIDYAGIAALIATSFYPPVYYTFMCDPFSCYLYLGFITLLGIVTIIFSLLPVFQKSHFRKYRTALYFGMGMSGVAPIVHKLILYRDEPEALETTGYEVLMGVLYAVGALIYVMRVPERWRPGRFDIAGQSHQIFHVFVVAGAYTHYHAGLIYLKWRDMKGCWLD